MREARVECLTLTLGLRLRVCGMVGEAGWQGAVGQPALV